MRNGPEKAAMGMLVIFPIVLVLGAAIGWVMNLVKIVGLLGSNEITTMFVARVIGVFLLPIGAVLGFL